MGIDSLKNKDINVIKFSTSDKIPEEFKDYKVDVDNSMSDPLTIRKKTHTEDRKNIKLAY
jgi:hypothetical protein